MSTHNIGFYGEIRKMIAKLSLVNMVSMVSDPITPPLVPGR